MYVCVVGLFVCERVWVSVYIYMCERVFVGVCVCICVAVGVSVCVVCEFYVSLCVIHIFGVCHLGVSLTLHLFFPGKFLESLFYDCLKIYLKL